MNRRCSMIVASVCFVLACSDGERQDDGASTAGASSGAGATQSTAGSDTTAPGGDATSSATATSNAGDDPAAGEDNGPGCPIDPDLPDELPAGTVGAPYTAEIDHGVPASTGSVSLVGMLPDGLQTVDAPGRITVEGTPTTAGSFPLELVSSTNDGGTCLPSVSYTLVIEDGTTTSDPTGDSSGG